MNKFNKSIEIVKNFGFEFVKTDQEANIIIKTPEKYIEAEDKIKYRIIRVSHICEKQIRLAVFQLLDLFEEVEDKEFLTKHFFSFYEGKLGENEFVVKI